MRLHKKICKGFILFFICILLVTGCKPMEQTEVKNSEWELFLKEMETKAPNEIGSHISVDVSEGFAIDADIVISDQIEKYEVCNLKLYRHIFDNKEELMQQLIEIMGWENVEEAEERVTDDVLENGENIISLGTVHDGKDYVQIRDSYLVLATEELNKYSNWNLGLFLETYGIAERYYMNQLEEPQELEFLSLEEVEEYAKKLSEELGVEYICDSKVYTCTYERLQSVVEQEQQYNQKIGWEENDVDYTVSKEDEAYFVELHQGYSGISLIPYGMDYTVTNSFSVQNQCELLVSADGILELGLVNIYDDIQKVGEAQKILSLSEILNIHFNRYKNSLVANEDGDITLTEKVVKIQLYYLPVCTNPDIMEFTAKPVWCFLSEVEDKHFGEGFSRSGVIYDAVTGEELPWQT